MDNYRSFFNDKLNFLPSIPFDKERLLFIVSMSAFPYHYTNNSSVPKFHSCLICYCCVMASIFNFFYIKNILSRFDLHASLSVSSNKASCASMYSLQSSSLFTFVNASSSNGILQSAPEPSGL